MNLLPNISTEQIILIGIFSLSISLILNIIFFFTYLFFKIGFLYMALAVLEHTS